MARKKKSPVPSDTGKGGGIVQQSAALSSDLPAGYAELLEDLRLQIRSAQVRAAVAASREMILLYWGIGRRILERQGQQGWGAKVIDRLSGDLRSSFPDMQGFSPRNLKYMRALAEGYPDGAFVQQVVAQIPWGHHTQLLDKVKDRAEREWYIRKTIEQGWSRAVLVHQIESGLYERQGRALTNFERTLPAPQSDLAREVLKDPYTFDFLTLAEDAREADLQRGLLEHLRHFLLELGVGFAFVGSRYHLEVGDQDYYLDLLFYHLRLRCFVVIELKVEAFEPEHAGKMNFYLSAVDDQLRHPTDQPSIGLILCKERNRVIVEYSLRDTSKPMGVASYEVRRGALPEGLRDSLPSVERLEAELGSLGVNPPAAQEETEP
jgi:predicted nuclease of restriction endonuclease-like (RecB) superfamily